MKPMWVVVLSLSLLAYAVCVVVACWRNVKQEVLSLSETVQESA